MGIKDSYTDLLNRSDISKQLANKMTSGNYQVIGLHGTWGSGKSFLLEKLLIKNLIKIKNKSTISGEEIEKIIKGDKNDSPIIYFNAFQHDHHSEAFEAIAYEILNKLEGLGDKDSDLENFSKNLKILLNSVSISVWESIKPILTAILSICPILSLLFDNLLVKNYIILIPIFIAIVINADKIYASKKIKGNLEQLTEYNKNTKNLRKVINAMKKSLENITKEKPIYFIIDELDRCRPNFALELLEKIKHIFDVKGITFLIAADFDSLGKIIQNIYGNINTDEYFRKFIDLKLMMPEIKDTGKLFEHYFKQNKNIGETLILWENLNFYKMTPRDVQHLSTIIQNFNLKQTLGSGFVSNETKISSIEGSLGKYIYIIALYLKNRPFIEQLNSLIEECEVITEYNEDNNFTLITEVKLSNNCLEQFEYYFGLRNKFNHLDQVTNNQIRQQNQNNGNRAIIAGTSEAQQAMHRTLYPQDKRSYIAKNHPSSLSENEIKNAIILDHNTNKLIHQKWTNCETVEQKEYCIGLIFYIIKHIQNSLAFTEFDEQPITKG